ncbi:MAG TPA: NTP transferase domain-containing protein [Natronosporangium sp.]
MPDAAVVLAGGAGKRLGGVGKPTLPVAGRPMLHRVLAAVEQTPHRIVVGPPELPIPPRVLLTREVPPGGGPVAATAAGLALVPAELGHVALLAADLPLLTADAIRRLRRAAEVPALDGAVFVDNDGWPQWLCGVWRASALRARLAALGEPGGVPLHALLGDLRVGFLGASGVGPPPWWDCDTGADIQRAEEWVDGNPG